MASPLIILILCEILASDQNFSATFKDDLSFSMHVILASFGLLIAKLKALYPYSVPISKIFLYLLLFSMEQI